MDCFQGRRGKFCIHTISSFNTLSFFIIPLLNCQRIKSDPGVVLLYFITFIKDPALIFGISILLIFSVTRWIIWAPSETAVSLYLFGRIPNKLAKWDSKVETSAFPMDFCNNDSQVVEAG